MSRSIQWVSGSITTANTNRDGTGTAAILFTAVSRVYLTKAVFQPLGTCVASVGRIFINNGSSPETAANNILIGEVSLPAVSASETAGLASQEVPLGFYLNRNERLLATIGTTVSAGYAVTAIPGPEQDQHHLAFSY